MAPYQRDRMKRSLTFWYEFASTYSWLSAERIEALAVQAGVEVAWRPFLLGPIFAAQGWTSSPFNLFPAKGRNMWRDMERQCARLGLPPIVRPDPFPQNSLLAARLATALPPAARARPILPRRLPGAIHARPLDRRPRGASRDPRRYRRRTV